MTARNPAQASTLASERVQPDGPLSGAVQREGALYATKLKRGETPHFVYVVNHAGDVVKIGHSKDPKKRIADMMVGSPGKIWLHHSWKMSRPAAIAFERRLHELYKPDHSHGEWFRVFPTDVVSIGNILRAGREEAAERVVHIQRGIRRLQAEANSLNRFWPSGRGDWKAKKAEAAAAKLQAAEKERQIAALMVEAMDMGLRPTQDDTYYEKCGGALSRYRAIAEGREWVAKPRYFGRPAEPYPDNEPRMFDPADHPESETLATIKAAEMWNEWDVVLRKPEPGDPEGSA